MSTLLQEHQQPMTATRLRDRVAVQRTTPRVSAGYQPAATVPNCQFDAPHTRWRVILGSIVATLREWRRRSVARRELANLDGWTLRDIGIAPSIVDYETHQWFWRPLRDCRH
jgi:uncharacterized protein YjiS (DUF1127 family)